MNKKLLRVCQLIIIFIPQLLWVYPIIAAVSDDPICEVEPSSLEDNSNGDVSSVGESDFDEISENSQEVQVGDSNSASSLTSPAANSIFSGPEVGLEQDISPLKRGEDSAKEFSEVPQIEPNLESSVLSSSPIQAKQIAVTGNTILGDQIGLKVKLWNDRLAQGEILTVENLNQLAEKITELYVVNGYITSYAIVNPESVNTEIAQLIVREGGISTIKVSGLKRLRSAYICDRLKKSAKAPVNARRLEESLRLLKLNPLFKNIEANLQSAEDTGQSTLTLTVDEASLFAGEVGFNNYAPPSVAQQQLSLGVRNINLTGRGDELALNYSAGINLADFGDAGLHLVGASYRIPVNSNDGAVQVRTIFSWSRVTDDTFEDLGLRGNSEFYEVAFRQPIVKSLREELALSLGFTVQNSQSLIFDSQPNLFELGPDENGFSRTRVLRFSQDYVRRDSKGAWALQSRFNLGLNALDATQNDGTIPDGEFFSWLGQAARFQDLGNDFKLIVTGKWQLTPDPLLPSQQFYLGGPDSLRGYNLNVSRADNGVSLGVEGRIPIVRNQLGAPILEIAPFADLGYVWNDSANPNTLVGESLLGDLGLGLIWQPVSDLFVKLDFGFPLVDLDEERDDLQDNGIYFNVNYSF